MSFAEALFIAQTAFALPPGLLHSVCFVESSLRPEVVRMDSNNLLSIGLCQVQLRTAKWLGYKGGVKGLLDPYANAYYAAKYLDYQYGRYGSWIMAVKAYNAGQARTMKHNRYSRRVFEYRKTLQ